jgi:hypothetical protein
MVIANDFERPMNGLVPRRKFYKALKVINEMVNPFIEQTLRLSPEELASKTKSESGYTFLHALATYTRDRQMLRDQLVAVLLAGRVRFFFVLLCSICANTWLGHNRWNIVVDVLRTFSTSECCCQTPP